MIKDQCNACKNKSTVFCNQNIIYDSIPCIDYVKTLGLENSRDLNLDTAHPSIQSENSSDKSYSDKDYSYGKQNNNKGSFLSSLFTFKGRIRRSTYWWTNICVSMLLLPSNMYNLLEDMPDIVIIYTLLVCILLSWISLSCIVKRLHDLGKRGRYALLYFIPIINIILCIYVAFVKGEECENIYGASPY